MPAHRSDQLDTARQRPSIRIQELQAENAQLLADLTQVRQERDSFRTEAAKFRKDSVKLANGLSRCL